MFAESPPTAPHSPPPAAESSSDSESKIPSENSMTKGKRNKHIFSKRWPEINIKDVASVKLRSKEDGRNDRMRDLIMGQIDHC